MKKLYLLRNLNDNGILQDSNEDWIPITGTIKWVLLHSRSIGLSICLSIDLQSFIILSLSLSLSLSFFPSFLLFFFLSSTLFPLTIYRYGLTSLPRDYSVWSPSGNRNHYRSELACESSFLTIAPPSTSVGIISLSICFHKRLEVFIRDGRGHVSVNAAICLFWASAR